MQDKTRATGLYAPRVIGALSHRTPWDGFKQSGFGRRYGEVGLEPFFEYPTVRVS